MSDHSESEDRRESPPVHEERHTVTHGSFVPGEEETETHDQAVGSFADMNQTTEGGEDAPPHDRAEEDEDEERVGQFSDGPDAKSDYVTRSEPEGSFQETEDEE
jgi:hypothetical protein